MAGEALPRLDTAPDIREALLPHCRLKYGEVWEDPVSGHRVGVLDATESEDIRLLMAGKQARLAANDPPYNLKLGAKSSASLFTLDLPEYLAFSRRWVAALQPVLMPDAHLYVWLGADQNAGFQPLPDFMIMMREFPEFRSRSFITMRNQRGYGTTKNWMSVRQELLYYVQGKPDFQVIYTEIPKILRGYYKIVGGRKTENLQRSRSDCIRAGNVWVDIQQVFYRMKENVPGAYAQKPLKSTERLILSGTGEGETVLDLFSHSGTTLLAAERTGRVCCTMDLDPVFAELSIRRLLRYRETGMTGWQWRNPFPEIEKEV